MKGDVYFHAKFPYSDGTFSEKRFVILNEPRKKEPCVVVKSTSQNISPTLIPGCHPEKKVFYLRSGAEDCFPIPTLIQLGETFELSQTQLVKGHLEEKTVSHKGRLPDLLIAQIINCIKKLKEDISVKHFEMIIRE